MAVMTLAAASCTAAAILLVTGARPGVARLTALSQQMKRNPQAPPSPPGSLPRASSLVPSGVASAMDSVLASARGRAGAGLCVALAGFLFVGGALGVILGAGLGVGAWYGLGRLEPRSVVRDRERTIGVLPLAADMVAAAIAAGCPPVVAVETVGAAIGGPLGRALTDAAAVSSVGAEPARVWARLAAEPASRPLARALAAAVTRGTSPGPALRRAAADARDAARWAGEARARSLGARAAAPLGLCFLPAFVLLGVVPIIATSGVLSP